MIGLGAVYLIHLFQVYLHSYDVKRYVARFNEIAQSEGVNRVKADSIGLSCGRYGYWRRVVFWRASREFWRCWRRVQKTIYHMDQPEYAVGCGAAACGRCCCGGGLRRMCRLRFICGIAALGRDAVRKCRAGRIFARAAARGRNSQVNQVA